MARSSRQTSSPSPVRSPSSTPSAGKSPANVMAVGDAGPTHEQIARRAYELYLQRGGTHGAHVDDWVQAERELRLRRS